MRQSKPKIKSETKKHTLSLVKKGKYGGGGLSAKQTNHGKVPLLTEKQEELVIILSL